MLIKPKISLFSSVGLGIIIPFPSGIFYSNQTGGTACVHPKVEGVYIPIANDYTFDTHTFKSPEIELTSYFMGEKHNSTGATYGLDQEDSNKISAILKDYRLDRFIEIDNHKLKESHESWVHIKIIKEIPLIMEGFNNFPINAILTWSNSD